MRWLKIGLKLVVGFFALVLILFVCALAYLHMNKKAVLTNITEQLNENISGKLEIESMEPTFIRGFPGVSISLRNVVLRDSLWDVHHHDLLLAKEIYVSVNALSILRGGARIRNVSINDASIYLFTDSTGYSNTTIFHPKPANDSTTKKKDQPRINRLSLNNVKLVFENRTKFKLFELNIKKLATVLDYTVDGWDADIDIDAQVKNMMFNTKKGSFLKNKHLQADLKIAYNKKTESLHIPEQEIELDKDEVSLGGKFVFAQKPASFLLHIKAGKIGYRNAISLLPSNISSKINILDFKKPIDIQAEIIGLTKFRDTPLVKVNWQVKDNTFITPGGDIKNCSFSGMFYNENIKGAGRSDRNALIAIKNLQGEWSGIPFAADTISVTNLISPVLEGRFTSKFNVTKLNPIIGGSTFHFDKGNVNVNILYKAGIQNNDTTQPYIFGTVALTDAAMTYMPRNLSFANASATLKFTGSDLFINNVKLQKGTTVLNMNGSLKNFLNLYYTAPQKILLDWHIRSPQINIDEFTSFLKARKEEKKIVSTGSNSVNKVSNQLDKVLDASSVKMQLQVDKILYRKFEANDLNVEVSLANTAITLKDFSVKHADGTLKVNAVIDQRGSINHFKLKTEVGHVDVRKFFAALENFNQDAITDKNVKGKLTADIDVTGAVSDDGKLVPRSINGVASFKFEDGALVNFEPLRKVSRFAFRKRNLDNITFNTIENKFDIKGDKITIYPMYIESSALNMHVEGIYAVGKTGTDINIDIPLRNPGKDELILDDDTRHDKNMKGLVLRLKAVDGEDGKVKMKWNRKNVDVADPDAPAEQIPVQKKKGLFRKRNR